MSQHKKPEGLVKTSQEAVSDWSQTRAKNPTTPDNLPEKLKVENITKRIDEKFYRDMKPQYVRCAYLLSFGSYSKTEIAKLLKTTPATITRWSNRPDVITLQTEFAKFQNDSFLEVAHEIETRSLKTLAQELAEYKSAQIYSYQELHQTALMAIARVKEQIENLPADAIQPQHLSGLLSSATSALRESGDRWAEVLGLEELLKELSGGS